MVRSLAELPDMLLAPSGSGTKLDDDEVRRHELNGPRRLLPVFLQLDHPRTRTGYGGIIQPNARF